MQFTLEEILDIAAQDIHLQATLLMQANAQAYTADRMHHRKYMLNHAVNLMMKRIRWHLLQLSPGPDTYTVTNAS